MNKPTNLFLFAANTAEMIHSSGVEVHDPFPYIKTTNGNEFVLLDGREYEIVKKILKAKKSKVVVEKLEDYVELAKKKSVKDKKFANLSLQEKVLICFLEEKKMKEFFVSENLESKWLLFLKKYGFKIDLQDLSSQRRYKTQPEIKYMLKAQEKTEKAFELVKNILTKSKIENRKIIWNGQILASEILKYEIKKFLLSLNMECSAGIIVASGKKQTSIAHDGGSGNILPDELIIVDIFPKDLDTGYFGDMTRTFVKGTASKEQNKIYEDVKFVQEKVLKFIKKGINTKEIYDFTVEEFKKLGHKTGSKNGFTHGLGHGLGLEIHEAPTAGMSATGSQILDVGDVLTVEPGLYYEKIGGVRIEDIIYINEEGQVKNMNKFEKVLEIVV